MSIVVEAGLSVLFERLLNDLISITPKLLNHHGKITDEIKKWGPILEDLRAVLEEAESNTSSNSKLERWVEDLEEIALDVEDMLEEFQYDIKQSQKQGNKLKRGLFTSFVSMLPSQPKVVKELKNLTARLNEIVERKNRLELLMGHATIPIQRAISYPAGPVSVERRLYGREEEKKKIIKFLMPEKNENIGATGVGKTRTKETTGFLRHWKDKVEVLPIVGAGGVGKTTLVQHIYNNDEVIRSFEIRAWVCVSRDWNLRNIFMSIIEAITKIACQVQDPSSMVYEKLKDKKFCIVLDDIWSLDILQWNELSAPFMAGAPGSKLLVTTRNATVAVLVKTIDTYIDLPCLSKDTWLELFNSYVGFDIRAGSKSKLKKVGEDIAKKCGGLPLAATIIGSRLHGNHNEDDWSAMLNDKSIMAQDGQYKIDSVLKMSYNDLPYNLKRCFLYCSIFPKAHRFREKSLVRLWIAIGLIKSDEVGNSYFKELVNRSLLTSFEDYYLMHDLIREMGRHVSNQRYCTWDNVWQKSRHLVINSSMIGQFIKDLGQREGETFSLQTLIIVGEEYDIAEIDEDNLFSKLPKLRVLQATALPIRKLSKIICQMKHLKYLELCQCIMRLPDEVGNLGSLQHLVLKDCKGLTGLPTDIGNLSSRGGEPK